MRIAAVIPTRNRPELLARAVASARGQVDEVVVVDDGSDPPVKLPEDHGADARIRLVRLEPGVGAAGARNVGIASTDAELVAFLDDDDEWMDGCVGRLLEALGSDDLAVACGFDLEGEVVMPPSAEQLPQSMLYNATLAPSCMLARRAALLEAGGFAEDVDRCEDWDLWLRLHDRGRIATLREPLVRRRRSRPHPACLLAARRAMHARLAARTEGLPPSKRRRVRAYHLLVEGVHLAQAGHRREATATLLHAFALNARDVRPLAALRHVALGRTSR